MFLQLDFDVKVYDNLTVGEIKEVIQDCKCFYFNKYRKLSSLLHVDKIKIPWFSYNDGCIIIKIKYLIHSFLYN